MVDPTYRSREEAPVVRPFKRFSKLEDALRSFELLVETPLDSGLEVVAGGAVKLPRDRIDTVGLKLRLHDAPGGLVDKLADGGLGPDDARLWVLALEPAGGHLKLSDRLWDGTLSSLGEELVLAERGKPRPCETLRNSHAGFIIRAVVTYEHDHQAGPLMPRRRGTILADSEFRVLPTSRVSGLQPKELTSEIRQGRKLPATSWLFVDRLQALHTTEHLTDAVEVYVDEDVLRLAGRQPRETRALAETSFAIPALAQLVFLLAADVAGEEGFVWDGTGSAALSLVQTQLKEAGKPLSDQDVVSKLKTDPGWVAAVITGAGGQRKRLKEAFGQTYVEEDSDVVSGS